MNTLFEVKGERPQWETIYTALAVMNVGDTITDVQLAAQLPDAPESSIRGAFWRAVRQVEDDHQRTFDRVRGIGYRMVAAREHENLARRQHKRAKRRLSAASRKAHSADRSLLSADERKRIDAIEDHLARQQEIISRLGERVERNEHRAAKTEKDQLALADRLDALNHLLTRHGIT